MYEFIAWHDTKSRRQFFMNYAKRNGFDPFQPGSWYSITTNQISAEKVTYYIYIYIY